MKKTHRGDVLGPKKDNVGSKVCGCLIGRMDCPRQKLIKSTFHARYKNIHIQINKWNNLSHKVFKTLYATVPYFLPYIL